MPVHARGWRRVAVPVLPALALALAALPAFPLRAQVGQPPLDTVSLAAPTADRLALRDYLQWEDVQDPQLSPDGRQIAYTRRWVDGVNDRWESAVWIMDADGSRNRFLLDGSSPRWSPDGRRIAFLAPGEPRGTQIFVRWVDQPGAATQITRLSETPASIAWSPDGRQIAFQMLVPERGDELRIALPEKPEGAKWTEAPRVVSRLDYRQDRQGFVDDGFRHLFVVDAEGGTPRQVTSGDWDHGAPEWTPDGRALVFSALRVPEAEYRWRESDLYRVEVASGQIRQLTTRKGPDNNPAVSPDGRHIAYTGYDSTDATWQDAQLWVMTADGGGIRALTPQLDRTPQNLLWARDGSGVYFSVDSEGSRNLWFAPLSGAPRQVTTGVQMLTVGDVARSGLAVGVRSTPQQPADVVTFTVQRPGELRQLTSVNADVLAGKQLGALEELWYPSADGLRVQGWILKPPGFDPARKYPMMLAIHGGPHSMYNVGFNFGWQEHAAQGYVVLYTNPRGSTGYGSAFGNAIKNAYPGKDYDDLMTAVDTVLARGYVDPQRLFVYGCSGGGVLTSWIVGHTDRFAAASANCPVTNWLSFVGTTDGAGWYNNFAKRPWEDPSEHLRRSPLMYVGNVKTPTMLMTGVNDLRTPITQTEEYYQALKLLKVPTLMVRFNDEWHGTSSRPSNFMRTQLYLRAWFEKHAPKAGSAVMD